MRDPPNYVWLYNKINYELTECLANSLGKERIEEDELIPEVGKILPLDDFRQRARPSCEVARRLASVFGGHYGLVWGKKSQITSFWAYLIGKCYSKPCRNCTWYSPLDKHEMDIRYKHFEPG